MARTDWLFSLPYVLPSLAHHLPVLSRPGGRKQDQLSPLLHKHSNGRLLLAVALDRRAFYTFVLLCPLCEALLAVSDVLSIAKTLDRGSLTVQSTFYLPPIPF
jgi:hypothetical protein